MYNSHTSIPKPRYDKMNIFQNHNKTAHQTAAKIVLMGDSLISNLSLFIQVWKSYFKKYKTLNFGVGGDKIQNCLWRIENMILPSEVTDIFFLIGTNNTNNDHPSSIVNGIISCGLAARRRKHTLNIHIIGLLPRDEVMSPRRYKIDQVNKLLETECRTNNFLYITVLNEEWVDKNYILRTNLYHTDHIHLSQCGNSKLAKCIIERYEQYQIKNSKKSKSFSNMVEPQVCSSDFPPLSLHHSATLRSTKKLPPVQTSTSSYHIFRPTIHRAPTVSIPIMCNTLYNVPVSVSPCVSLIKSLPIKRPNKVRPSKGEKLDYIPPSINVAPSICNVSVR